MRSHPTASSVIEFEGGTDECRNKGVMYSTTHFAKTNPIRLNT
jgi:hypothetical protein